MLVHARGGDGKTPLHCARTMEIAHYLIDRGADLEARDVDHESTPAQYLVRDAPEVTRLLVAPARGSTSLSPSGCAMRRSSSVACATTRRHWITASVRASIRWRTTERRRRHARRSATAAAISTGGYSTMNISAIEAAARLGNDDILELLLRSRHAGPALARCVCEGRPCRRKSHRWLSIRTLWLSLRPEQMRLIADKAQDRNTAAVALMLDLGFDREWPAPTMATPCTGPRSTAMLRWCGMLLATRSADRRPRQPLPRHGARTGACTGPWRGGRKTGGDFPTRSGCSSNQAKRSSPRPANGSRRCGRRAARLSGGPRTARLLLVFCSPVRKLKLPLLLEIELCRNLFRASHRIVDVGENIRLPDVRMELCTGHQERRLPARATQ